jgi:hypothetical protein
VTAPFSFFHEADRKKLPMVETKHWEGSTYLSVVIGRRSVASVWQPKRFQGLIRSLSFKSAAQSTAYYSRLIWAQCLQTDTKCRKTQNLSVVTILEWILGFRQAFNWQAIFIQRDVKKYYLATTVLLGCWQSPWTRITKCTKTQNRFRRNNPERIHFLGFRQALDFDKGRLLKGAWKMF